jgi:VanZ family protein
LILYWLALAVATHLPKPPDIPLEQGDKLMHFAAYALLAFLAAGCWSAYRSPLRKHHLFGLFVVLSLYAAVDELTQIPFGRQADVLDWLADTIGVACGIGAFAVARKLIACCSSCR